MPELTDVAVVGAGILGAVTAYHLARLGVRRTMLFDGAAPGSGATGRSGALVRSNYGTETEARLAEESLSVFRNFADEVGGTCGWCPSGLLVLSSVGTAVAHALVERQQSWGVNIEVVDRQTAEKLSPGVRTDDTATFAWQATAGHCDPVATLRSYLAAANDLGVTLLAGDRAIAVDSGVIRLASGGQVAAGAVVVAAGLASGELLARIGLNYGMVPRWSPVAIFRSVSATSATPLATIIDDVQSGWFKPVGDDGILVGADRCGILGLAGGPDVPTQVQIEMLRAVLAHRFPNRDLVGFLGARAGTYLMSPDGRPIVGGVEGEPNLFVAVGDSGGAFKIAPALGKKLAETVVGCASAASDLKPLSPARLAA